ncbi:TonB-dependent receptor [Psychrobium sp. MM17-31]|uniref:TonB-dependent receptor domain-containing protein n=1 Tax=Psychrobium sp. MM17-31 TaxID=2917758 RepID=UPI001EF56BCF|nr:TonB-dependent receptor [Psychrobium sp. MM17-31]MCG7532306.1 TonB-dependent receptor [Psychrobium sp. MM17-31]
MIGVLTRLRCIFLVIMFCGASVVASSVEAVTLQFDIPAQSLPSALDQFSRQSGYQVSSASGVLERKTSRAIKGQYSIEQAITLILNNQSLDWFISGTNILITARTNGGVSSTVLPTVKVQGSSVNRASERVYEAAASQSHITQKEIQRTRGSSVGDIFQSESGVLVGENRNSGGLDVNIRGMQGQGRVPVLLDGSRQETTVYRGYAGVASRTYIDPDLIGGIDIHKGPELSAQGSGATGGVVSVRTLDASDLIAGDGDFGGRVRMGLMGNTTNGAVAPGTESGFNPVGGDNGAYRINCSSPSLCEGPYDINKAFGSPDTLDRPDLLALKSWSANIAFAKRFEKVDLILAYAEREQGNYYSGSDGPAPTLDISNQINRGFWTEVRPELTGVSRFRAEEMIANSNYQSQSSLVKGQFYLNDYQTLKLGWQSYDSTYGELMPSQLVWFGQVRQTPGSTVKANTYTLRYNHQSEASDWLDLEANIWKTDTQSTNHSYSADISGGLAETEDYQRWGGDFTNTNRGDTWRVSYGVSWQEEKIDTKPIEGNATAFGRDGTRSEYGAFINVNWQPIPTVNINTGLRYTRFDVLDNKPVVVSEGSEFCQIIAGTQECQTLRNENDYSGSAPVLSMAWQVSDTWQLYARHSQALRMPSLFESSAGFSTQPALDVTLKPEHAKNNEIGLNGIKDNWLIADDRFRIKFAYFRNRTDDYLTRTSPNLWEDESTRIFFVTRNIDSVKFYGSELSAEYDAGRFYVKVGATHYHFIEVCHYGSFRRERCNDYGIANSYINNMIPPNQHANATIAGRWLDKTLEIGTRLTWMGKRNEVPEFDDQTQQGRLQPIAWHSYQLINLFASYSWNKQLDIDLNIDNLTDKYYLDALSLGLVPAPGRTMRLNFTYRF